MRSPPKHADAYLHAARLPFALEFLVERSHVSRRSSATLPFSPKYMQPDARQLLFVRSFSHFVLAPIGSMCARERGFSEVEVVVE